METKKLEIQELERQVETVAPEEAEKAHGGAGVYGGFAGGISVAAGDVNGDGAPDIITGAGPGAPGGHIKVFDGRG